MMNNESKYREALEEIKKDAPASRIGIEEAISGGYYDDAYYGGANDEHFRLAEIAKAALSEAPGEPSEERDLTPEEAFEEAKRRWGSKGCVELVYLSERRKSLEVGEYEWDKSMPPARIWKQHWTGETFRAAFAAADKLQIVDGQPVREGKSYTQQVLEKAAEIIEEEL